MNVVVAGGGTAGHIEPAMNLADVLRARGITVTALGTARGLDTTLIPARGYELDLIPPVPLPRTLTPSLLAVPVRLARAVRAASAALRKRHADVVVGFGGYVAVPAYLAARRRRVPLVVHEANARPGIANRLGARWATTVATSYPDTDLPRAQLVGIPLREAVRSLDRAARRAEGRREFGLDALLPTLLVFGGSQGARRLNDAVAGVAAELDGAGVQVLHATGAGNYDSVSARLAAAGLPGDGPPYVARPYLDRMDLAYAAADLAVSRAGANTVAELTAVGLPSVYVPLPIGNGEQRRNAAHVIAAGGGLHVGDADFTPDAVRSTVLPLLRDSDRLVSMAAAARGEGHADAADRLADLVIAAAEGTRS